MYKFNYYKTAVCVISKNEEQYLDEWIKHYKELCFDNILFYDNNDEGDDSQYTVLKPYIDKGFVVYHDYKNNHNCSQQSICYKECLKTYKDEFDYIAFFDVDEFLELGEFNNIHNFLSSCDSFMDCNSIAIRWIIMDDNDLVYNDGRPCKERFTRMNIDFQPNMKSIVNTNNLNLNRLNGELNPHYLNQLKIYNIYGKKCEWPYNKTEKNPKVYLKHFRFKTVQELVDKINKGDVYFINFDRKRELIDWFFTCNKRTEEKENILNSAFNE